jgi:hypothetical protein
MKTICWSLLLGLSWVACVSAEPTGDKGIWIDPPGYIGQCFVCPDNITSDCMDAEPIYIKIVHGRDGFPRLHITQSYPVAWSEETGLRYKGHLALTSQFKAADEGMIILTSHWLREDGLGVVFVQQIWLQFTPVDGCSQIEIMHGHTLFTCH